MVVKPPIQTLSGIIKMAHALPGRTTVYDIVIAGMPVNMLRMHMRIDQTWRHCAVTEINYLRVIRENKIFAQL